MEHKFLICVDPQTRLVYRLNLESHEVAYENEISDKDRENYDSQAKTLETLKGFDISVWTFESEACWNYRRRALWNYLLQQDAYPYPAYITSRELSSAFADVTDINLLVDIGDYINEDELSPPNSDDEGLYNETTNFIFSKAEKTVRVKASLVTCSNEVIKNMVRHVYKNHRIKLKPKSQLHQLTFKVKGRREYFTGNYPMLAYRQVRIALRGLEYLSVTLTEVPKKWESKFPPYLDVVEKGKNPLFWYPPAPLPYEADKLVQKKPFLSMPRIFHLNKMNPSQVRTEITEKLMKGVANNKEMFTGECEWPFRVKICGLEGIYNLYTEAYWGNAVKNGEDTPAYVIMPKIKEKGKDKGNHARSRSTNSSYFRKSSLPLLNRKQKSSSRTSLSSRNALQALASSAHINHGPSCYIPQDLSAQFRLPFTPYVLSFEVMLLYGDSILRPSCYKQIKFYPFQYYSRFYQLVDLKIKISELPKETRLGINIYTVGHSGETALLGCAIKTLFDERGVMRTGLIALNIWPFYRVEDRLACMEEYHGISTEITGPRPSNVTKKNNLEYARIYVMFEKFITPEVTWSLKDYNYMKKVYRRLSRPYRSTIAAKNRQTRTKTSMNNNAGISGYLGDDGHEEEDGKLLETRPQIEELASLEKVLLHDPLSELTEEERRLLFICRDHYKTLPLALPLFLKSVNWSRPLQVKEAYKMLENWSQMQPEDALSLLNADFPDENVRLYACRRIAQLPDDDLALYMPQLAQALCFESQHYSPLGELLIERSLKNPHIVGHELFWELRSQLHVKALCERIGVILEQFLMLCGSYREDLFKEVNMIELFSYMSIAIKDKENHAERVSYLRKLLSENAKRIDETFTEPVDSSMEAKGIKIDKSKVMSSKKMPLWLTLINSELNSGDIPIIFKNGDDLRQDVLTLQMIRVMDMIWLENGLDLRMKPYRVVATADKSGVIQVVPQSKTTADIQTSYGGALGALKKQPLKEYLKEHNPKDDQYEKSFDNFIRSCAGYCVATYILGIGDRHNDNIMLTETGHLFHIDFGHFLGNFKQKFGIKRERSKFVLTEEMAYVMGGKESDGFLLFKDYCCKAYNLVRKHGRRLINLFLMMISAGILELPSKNEINYLREMLSLKLTEMEADNKFTQEIDNALNNTFRKIDNFIHTLKH